jgi:glycosyltransferase involved in cell wall biosynthesis
MLPPLKKMSLSLCMIVRNNEDTLFDCLESIKSVVDEIVIVDTGSTDSTKKIALSFTDKVFDFKWNDNFSNARNEALKHARGNLILWLDSDDFVPESTVRAIEIIRKDNDSNVAYYLNIRNVNRSDWATDWDTDYQQLKIFPNREDIKFKGMIHESVELDVMADKKIELRLADFFIEHRGYSDPVKLEEKIHRDIKMTIISDSEKERISPPEIYFQFRIEKYFFVYTPNILRMYTNKYNSELKRTVLTQIDKELVFQDRVEDFKLGVMEQAELLSRGYQMIVEAKKNEKPYVEEMYRLINTIRETANI